MPSPYGSKTPHGIDVPKSTLFIDEVAVNATAAELNSITAAASGTANFQVLKKAGTATNGAVVFTSLYTISGFLAQGYTSANAPLAIATAVVSGKTLTITPTAGGVVTDTWYVEVWA